MARWVAELRAGTRRLYLPDPLGSTVGLVNSAQTKSDTWQYWPCGEVRTRTGATPTPFQYVGTAGYYFDTAALTYVRARVLNTSLGRWMTRDPAPARAIQLRVSLGAASAAVLATRPASPGYCGSNPSGRSDPTGLDDTDQLKGCLWAAVVTALAACAGVLGASSSECLVCLAGAALTCMVTPPLCGFAVELCTAVCGPGVLGGCIAGALTAGGAAFLLCMHPHAPQWPDPGCLSPGPAPGTPFAGNQGGGAVVA